jgi:hypothetical protein
MKKVATILIAHDEVLNDILDHENAKLDDEIERISQNKKTKTEKKGRK